MSADELKLKDLPVRVKIAEKHKKVLNALYIITFFLFLPVAIIQVINEILEKITDKFACLRTELVYTIFKVFYKKEIIENEKKLEKLLE